MNLFSKKMFICFLLIGTATTLITYRSFITATLLGYYRSEGYNIFTQLYEFNFNAQSYKSGLPHSLKNALEVQNIDLNRLDITSSIVIWGQLIEPEQVPADYTYNVIFHPDVLNWRKNNNDFNINILAGLFDPNGVLAAQSEPIAIDTLAQLNVNKHDGIYYSPNNGRFQVQSDRQIVTFWTVGISEDKANAVITFNIIIHNSTYQNTLSDKINDAHYQEPTIRNIIIVSALEELAARIPSADDKMALINAINIIKKV